MTQLSMIDWENLYTSESVAERGHVDWTFWIYHRAKKQSEETRRVEEAAISQLQHMMLVKRKKAMRELHQKRLNTLHILPAREYRSLRSVHTAPQ